MKKVDLNKTNRGEKKTMFESHRSSPHTLFRTSDHNLSPLPVYVLHDAFVFYSLVQLCFVFPNVTPELVNDNDNDQLNTSLAKSPFKKHIGTAFGQPKKRWISFSPVQCGSVNELLNSLKKLKWFRFELMISQTFRKEKNCNFVAKMCHFYEYSLCFTFIWIESVIYEFF